MFSHKIVYVKQQMLFKIGMKFILRKKNEFNVCFDKVKMDKFVQAIMAFHCKTIFDQCNYSFIYICLIFLKTYASLTERVIYF